LRLRTHVQRLKRLPTSRPSERASKEERFDIDKYYYYDNVLNALLSSIPECMV
jgi:hypothetical protein